MLHLFILEFCRDPIKECLLTILTTATFLLGLAYLSAYISHKNNTIPLGIAIVHAIAPVFSNYKTIATLTSILSMVYFVVSSAAVFNQFIIHDFTGERFYLLLSYPTRNSVIFLAKAVTTVTLFISAMLLCSLLVFTSFYYTETIFPMVKGDTISASLFYNTGELSLLFSVIAAAIGFISMRIGFVKKSSHAALTIPFASSVLLSNLLNISLLADLSAAMTGFTAFAIVLFLAGAIFALILISEINQMEEG